jgi:hypothetical protein
VSGGRVGEGGGGGGGGVNRRFKFFLRIWVARM